MSEDTRTYGEKRCNINFNPDNNDYVAQIKMDIAGGYEYD